MTDIFKVAALGGRLDLIDTPDEIFEVQEMLCAEYDKPGEVNPMIERMAELIDANPESSFRINSPIMFSGVSACKSGDEIQDCADIIIPIPEGSHTIFPVRSGAMFANFIDYVSLNESQWTDLIMPLSKPAPNAAAERVNLREVVIKFDDVVSYEYDIPGFLGNLFPLRGQQDCTDETATLAPLLHTLSAAGYLKFHTFDPLNAQTGIPLYHYAAKICENDGECYVVDSWRGASITEISVWKFVHTEAMQQQFRPKY
jgi:hypothetical protein